MSKEEREIRPLGIVELDTVEGIKGGELLFTIMFPCFSLMLGFKIRQKTKEEISRILDELEDKLDSYFYISLEKQFLIMEANFWILIYLKNLSITI